MLKAIELLCNGSSLLSSLSIDDFRTVSGMLPLIHKQSDIPPMVLDALADYNANKGTRGWRSDDRATMVRAALQIVKS